MSGKNKRTAKISFLGGQVVAGLPKQVELDVPKPLSISSLFGRLEKELGISDLRAGLAQYFIIVVDGTSIEHLQGWETIIEPGASVSVVAPMGGGTV